MSNLEPCYRHVERQTGVHCTRCGKPICVECMIAAPVGHHCPGCVALGRGGGVARRRWTWLSAMSVFTLIATVNLLTHVLADARPGLADRLLFDEAAIAAGQYYRLLTITMVHVGWLHLAVNTVSLVVLGSMVEPLVGRLRFAGIYLVSAIGAATSTFLAGPATAAGASGAIFGLSGALIAISSSRRLDTRSVIALTLASLVLAPVLFGVVDNVGHAGGVLTGLSLGAALEWGRRRPHAVLFEVGSVVMVLAVTGGLVAGGIHRSPPPSFYERFLEHITPDGGPELDAMLLGPPRVSEYQTTRSGRMNYRVFALRHPERARTFRFELGDGAVATASVARGSGWVAKTFSHRFPPGLARYDQALYYDGAGPLGIWSAVTDVCPDGTRVPTVDDSTGTDSLCIR